MVVLPALVAFVAFSQSSASAQLQAGDQVSGGLVQAKETDSGGTVHKHQSLAERAKREREAFFPQQSYKAQFDDDRMDRPEKPTPEGSEEESPVDAVDPDVASTRPTRQSNFTCPTGMQPIGEKYCIDTWEASLIEVKADGSEQPWSPFQPPKAGVVLRAVTLPSVYPQGYISGVQAAAACEASGKRLCKPDEWKKACMGPKETIWPYGAEHKELACNDHGKSSMLFFNPGLSDKPEDAWKWGAGGNMMDPRLNQMPGSLARTGDHPACTNEYGVYDMVGNVHEWVDDPAGTFQGGYYLDTHLNADGCYYRTTKHDVKHADYSTGFRCCADVDPI
jgi:hypothetical protein